MVSVCLPSDALLQHILLQYFCLENPMDRRAWYATVNGVTKSRARLSNFTFTFHFHALEKEMATHSSILTWRIPGMEQPGGLPSMESHRVRQDWSDLAATAASTLAWRIPWIEEPGRQQSMGSQRVGLTEQLTLSLFFSLSKLFWLEA